MIRFLPARQIRRTIGAAAAAVIADEYTETYPCPLARVAPYVLRAVFYRETGRPPQRTVELPRYVAEVTAVWRSAIDAATRGARWSVQPGWSAELARWSEGQQHTLGAYERPWR
jgi:hypothetical protein